MNRNIGPLASGDATIESGARDIDATHLFTDAPVLIHAPALRSMLSGQGVAAGKFMIDRAVAQGDIDYRNGCFIQDGVAIVSVRGALSNRGNWCYWGYDELGERIGLAVKNPSVHTVMLDIDSPGGMVAGVYDLASRIRELGEQKNIVACVADLATSAAYLLASACSEIVMGTTSIVGSIGVVMHHVDVSKMRAGYGMQDTLIFAGDHKVDGNSFGPLPDGVRANLQQEIDDVYQTFTATVAEYRGMEQSAVVATQAQTYTGQQAVDIGLADRVAARYALLAELGERMPNPTGVSPMTTSYTQAQLDAAVIQAKAEATEAAADSQEQTQAQAVVTAIAGERERIKAIVGGDTAKGRGDLAMHLAFDSDMTAEKAAALLAKSPAATAKSSQSTLDGLMAGELASDIADGDDGGEVSMAQQLANAHLRRSA